MTGRRSFIPRQLRARPLACFAVCFLLGLIAARRVILSPIVAGSAAAALLAASVALKDKRRPLAVALLMPVAFVAGMCRYTLVREAIPAVETRYSVEMTGRIVSEPFTNPDTGRVIAQFQLESADGEPSALRLRLYLRGDEAPLREIDFGQRLALTGHIWACDPPTNPWEFDFGEYLRRDGMAAYATAKIEDVTIMGTQRDARSAVVSVRRAVGARIDALFPRGAAMVRALVLGDRSLLSDEMRDAMNRTGTAHLISISGLHVIVLAAMLSLLLGLFMPRRRANALTLLFLIPYGVLIGFNAPFARALVMFAIVAFAPMAGLLSDSVTRLAAAMLVYLLARPLDIGDAGFALSFGASAGLILLTPPLTEALGIDRLRRRKPPARRSLRLLRALALYLPELLCASLAAQLATLPAVVAWFGVQSVVSLPFNLVCVPLCMLGYLCSLAALALSLVCAPLGEMIARAPEALFAALSAVTRWSGSLPQTVVRIGRYPAALVLAHAVVLLAASNLSLLPQKAKRFLPAALVLLAALSSLLTFTRAWPFSIAFLDADQADCAVVRSRGRTYLIDVGDTYTPAADYLSATCLHLDGIVLSHPHQDHAGGLKDVLTAFRPDAIYVPEGWFDAADVAPAILEGIDMARRMGVPVVELRAGDQIALSGAATLTVYAPAAGEEPASVNDMSLLAQVRCEGQAALFTGDLSQAGEPPLIPDADILKVAHHGSDKGTSQRLLEACTPDIAVISVGENSYGHPGEETLGRLADSGARIYQTRERGAITLTWIGGKWRVETYLEAVDELE